MIESEDMKIFLKQFRNSIIATIIFSGVVIGIFISSDILGYKKIVSNLTKDVENANSEIAELKKVALLDPELLKLYSKVYFLSEHYIPASLTSVDVGYLPEGSRPVSVHSNIYPYLKKLIQEATNASLSIRVDSAYRSFSDQQKLKAHYKLLYGAGTANSFAADQGYSEHQLGTAIDFTSNTKNGVSTTTFEKSPEFEWMLANAYKYGFIISYPQNNGYYQYEPWHWRFVGIALATKIHDEHTYFYRLNQRTIDKYLPNIFN